MNEPVYFLKLELENVRCFGEKAVLDLSDGNGNWRQWTVILGDNGTGKTTLLTCIALLEQKLRPEKILDDKDLYVANIDGNYSISFKRNKRAVLTGFLDFWDDNEQATVIVGDDTDGLFSYIRTNVTYSGFLILGYGANRFLTTNQSTEKEPKNSQSLFSDTAHLINAEEWLLNLDYAASRDSHLKEFASKRKILVEQTLLSILPDIQEIRFTTPTLEKLIPGLEFLTSYGFWVTIHQLSLGYKTMVAWMVDLAARMFARYPESDNPLAEPAIVLVDEIDLHLHPKWQRKIFGYLSERFPKTQFVVTAHSPLVVQSAPKDANIVVLRKEGDHVVIDNDVQSVHNWRLDQILSSDLFGIESSRGPETAKWMDERKALLQKTDLSVEEKQRLGTLNEKASALPTADNEKDIAAMELIRRAAKYIESQNMPLAQ